MKSISAIKKKISKNHLITELKIIRLFFYSNIFGYILLYIQNVLINRYMPAPSLGRYSYSQSMLVLFITTYSMEVYSIYLRCIDYNNEKELLKKIRQILLVASVLFCITVVIYFKSPLYCLFFGYAWMHERLYFFRAKMDISTYGHIKISQYILSIICIIILIKLKILNENSLLICIGASYIIISIIYTFNNHARQMKCMETNLPVVKIKDIITYALPLSFNAIVVWVLGAADQMLISRYLDSLTLTYYSVGFRIINTIRIGTGVIMEYWPRFYFVNMEKKEYGTIKVMYMIFAGLVIVLCLGSVICSKQLYWAMGAKQYADKSWMFSILAIAEMFRQLGSINMTFQTYMKNNAINIICLSALGGIKLMVNWINVSSKGAIILFQTTLICYFLYFCCSLYFGCLKEKQYLKVTSKY